MHERRLCGIWCRVNYHQVNYALCQNQQVWKARKIHGWWKWGHRHGFICLSGIQHRPGRKHVAKVYSWVYFKGLQRANWWCSFQPWFRLPSILNFFTVTKWLWKAIPSRPWNGLRKIFAKVLLQPRSERYKKLNKNLQQRWEAESMPKQS